MASRFVLDTKGVKELLKSEEMRAIIQRYAFDKASSAGDGYNCSVHYSDQRVIANVYPDTAKARKDNYDNNTLLRVL